MKKILSIAIVASIALSSCTKDQFADAYANPSTVATTTVDRQFVGFMTANLPWIMHRYTPYFVTYQNTMMPWTQSAITYNTAGRYLPGAAAMGNLWNNYYATLAQYKELVRLNSTLSADEQKANRLYMIGAAIYYYDYTQKMVDLWGDIPWSAAGLLGTNGGDYQASAAKYDDAASIYTKMLDDLKAFADELNTITVPASVTTTMKTQDFLNHGDLTKWKQYCNSLRIKILTRVNKVTAFQSRVSSEIAAILANPTSFPLVTVYTDNIRVNVVTLTSGINNGTNTGASSDFYTGIIGWGNADRAGKVMIDTMNNNTDPRLRAMFEPGTGAGGVYIGLDPSLSSTTQLTILQGNTIARYNRSTLSQNNNLPGVLINAAEINFMLAEYYLNAGNDASAKTAYEAGITQSINFYFWLRTISNDNTVAAPAAVTASEISNCLASKGVSWTAATTATQKLERIAIQKWINNGVLHPIECWSEVRRLKLPVLNFVADIGVQPLPPNRFIYPTSELTYNATNYQTVQAKDNLATKIFWDVR